jgi:hypothetical protein
MIPVSWETGNFFRIGEYYEVIDNDTLVLTDNVADGFTSKYARIN